MGRAKPQTWSFFRPAEGKDEPLEKKKGSKTRASLWKIERDSSSLFISTDELVEAERLLIGPLIYKVPFKGFV